MTVADVFDEISDDLRRERLNQFWKENGSWIIGGAVGAVLLTAFLAFWKQWEYRRDMSATTEMTRLAISPSSLPQLEAFAQLTAAGEYLAHNEKDKALALYDTIAHTGGIDKLWRDLASVLSIGQRLDKGAPDVLEKELAGLSGDKDPWRYTARELTALLAARQGQMQMAAYILAGIASDPQAPEDARRRALTLRALYAAYKKNAAKP
jgi:hypothetical protein